MFRIDEHEVVDATMSGNAARFINHSCEVCQPYCIAMTAVTYTCYSQIVILKLLRSMVVKR